MKNKHVLSIVFLLLAGGCTQVGPQARSSAPAVVPAVVFEPSDSSYILSCVNELQAMKKKNFERYYSEAASRIRQGDDRDLLRFACLGLHPKADPEQFQQGKKLLRTFIDEHPDAAADMEGLFFLYSRLPQVKVISHEDELKTVIAERDALLKEIETLQMQLKRDQGRIKELQGQIDQLKNIESIIKNREH